MQGSRERENEARRTSALRASHREGKHFIHIYAPPAGRPFLQGVFCPGFQNGISATRPRACGTESTRVSTEVLYLKQTSPRDGKEGEEGESRGGAQPYKTKFICCWALSRDRIGLAATEKQIPGPQRQPKRSSVPRGCPQVGYSCQTHAD